MATSAVMLRILFISLPLLALTGCTWLVLQDASTATCADDIECGAGTRCEDGGCVAVGPQAPPPTGTVIDGAGGVVAGPEGITLTLPPGAVPAATVFVIERETATVVHDNFEASGPFVTISPVVTFAVLTTLVVPGDGALFQRPADDGATWAAIDGAGDAFEISTTGTFVRGALLEAP